MKTERKRREKKTFFWRTFHVGSVFPFPLSFASSLAYVLVSARDLDLPDYTAANEHKASQRLWQRESLKNLHSSSVSSIHQSISLPFERKTTWRRRTPSS